MSQIIRCSPQTLGIDEARDMSVHLSEQSVSIDGYDESLYQAADTYYSHAVEDAVVVAQLKAQLVPLVAARQSVTVIVSGHHASGKTCLTEQLLPAVLDGLKTAVISADEAHQEAVNMGVEVAGSVRRSMSPIPMHLTSKSNASALSNDDSHSQNMSTTEPRRDTNRKSIRKSIADSKMSQSKYSLMLARMPRDAAAVEMALVDSRALGSPRPLLPRLHSVVADTSKMMIKEESVLSPSRLRLAIERAKTPIHLAAGSLTSLGAKNGRGIGEHMLPNFDGNVHYTMEPVHELDKVLKEATKSLCISFWVQIDDPSTQQCIMQFYDAHEPNYALSIMANTNDLGQEEAGHTLVTIRDSHGKRLEGAFTTCMEDGRWHFVEISILMNEKRVHMVVDEKLAKVKAATGENVSSFHDSRPKVGLIGSYSEAAADGTRTTSYQLKGSLMDLTFTELVSNRRVACFNFRGPEIGTVDSMGSLPALQGDVEFFLRYFPHTSPSFDGYERFVNLGQIGDLGQWQVGTKIDITFRTTVTNEKMCLIGVSDNVGKHPGFGIELNTNGQNQMQRYMMSFWIQDRQGELVRATAELSTAFDDKWHTVSIILQENDPVYKFKVRLDGRHCDCGVQSNGHPKDFAAYTQYVSLGAFHQKNDHWRYFRGAVKQVLMSRVRDEVEEPLAAWMLNEGPGAVIAMDATSHGLCGIYYLKAGVKGAHFFPSDRSDGEDGSDDTLAGHGKGTTRYSNNMVTMAFCEIRTGIDSRGVIYERLTNLLTGAVTNELETVPLSTFNLRTAKSDPRILKTIPEEWFQRVTPNDFMATFKAGQSKMEDSHYTHTVFVLRLGDASFTVMDLASVTKSSKAVFSPSQLSWSDAVSLHGSENRIHFSINTALDKLDKMLLKCGAHPQLYKRSVLQRPSVKMISDTMLTNIAAFALFAPREAAQLFAIHMFSPRSKAPEILQALLLAKRLRDQDRLHATLVLQKLFRWRKAFLRFSEKLRLRKEADSRKEKSALLRKQYPKDVLEKERKMALIISCTDFEYDESMPKCWSAKNDDFAAMPRFLEAIGFKCELMLNPSRNNLIEALQRKRADQAAADAMLLVHFIGVGGRGCYHRPASAAVQLAWLMDTERYARLDVLARQRKDMSEFYVDEQFEWNLLYDQMKADVEEAEKKSKKKKKKDDKAPPIPTLPQRANKPSKEYIIKAMSRWDDALAPVVVIPQEVHDAILLITGSITRVTSSLHEVAESRIVEAAMDDHCVAGLAKRWMALDTYASLVEKSPSRAISAANASTVASVGSWVDAQANNDAIPWALWHCFAATTTDVATVPSPKQLATLVSSTSSKSSVSAIRIGASSSFRSITASLQCFAMADTVLLGAANRAPDL